MGYGIPNFEEAYLALQTLGIEDQLLKENFAIYPNPVTDVMNVSFPQEVGNAVVTVYDVLGKQVLQQQVTVAGNRVDFTKLSAGMYIANINGDGINNNFKILKK